MPTNENVRIEKYTFNRILAVLKIVTRIIVLSSLFLFTAYYKFSVWSEGEDGLTRADNGRIWRPICTSPLGNPFRNSDTKS